MTELRTGEALVFCPTAQIRATEDENSQKNQSLGFHHMRLRIRKRITLDGGVSLVATAEAPPPRSTQEYEDGRIKMHEPVAKAAVAQSSKPALNKATAAKDTIPVLPTTTSANCAQSTAPGGKAVSLSGPTGLSTGQARAAPVGKVTVTTQAEMRALAAQYARDLAREKSWSHATIPDVSERQRFLKAFKATFEGPPQIYNTENVKMVLFGELGVVLVRNIAAHSG